MTNKGKSVTVRKRAGKNRPELKLYASCPAGLEHVLVSELKRVGAFEPTASVRGANFYGDLQTVYKANLWLRTAHRVLWEIGTFDARDRHQLYDGVRAVNWLEHMNVDQTLAVDAVSNRSEMDHTQFISRVVKDAVVDCFRDAKGRRPNVDPRTPDLLINARIHENRCTLSIDTSGERLHRRGYRAQTFAEAPLQETLAAGIVILSGYTGEAPLVDPMCGSGTLLIEAALIAKNMAPGLLGREFGFTKHPSFDKRLWRDILREAKDAVKDPEDVLIVGSDVAENAVRSAKAAVLGAGVDDVVRLRQANFAELKPRADGMLITNPPYGQRIGDFSQLHDLYRSLGDTLKWRCRGMTAHVFTGSKELAKQIGLKSFKKDILWNGPIECRLIHYELY